MNDFPRRELKELLKKWRPGVSLACPRCAAPLVVETVNPREEVAYVRWRAVVVCPGCGARGAGDRPPPGVETRP